MGLYKSPKNKTFNYTPRYYKYDGEGSPYQIKHKFDEFRKTVGANKGIKARLNNALDDYKNNPNKKVDRKIFIIASILIVLFLIFIGFDLTIFFPQQ